MLKMVKFYKLDEEKVIDTVTDIPLSMWDKKNILPYKVNYVDVEIGTTTNVIEGITTNVDNVTETKIRWTPKPLTLDEYKLEKYNQLKKEGSDYILGTYSLPQQTSAIAGFYTPAENEAIITFAKKYFNIIRSTKIAIEACTTKSEVDAVYFRKAVFAPNDTLMITPVSYIFWGE